MNDLERLAAHFGPENPLRVFIITLSDRASRGEYEDRGGPAIRQALESFFGDANVPLAIASKILPDDADRFASILNQTIDGGVNLIISTGSTGLGPRDIAPDVVLSVADCIVPGIMEQIRLKYGEEKPLALLSRSVAATKRTTAIYTLPGSPRAVSEYMTEILKTLPHVLCVLNGIESH